jgi:hypothetical protein
MDGPVNKYSWSSEAERLVLIGSPSSSSSEKDSRGESNHWASEASVLGDSGGEEGVRS